MSDRDRFKAWISAPPHEYRLDQFAMDDTRYGRWSGQYINFAVQLAWEAWCAASEQRVEREKALEDALSHTTDLLEGRDFAKRHYEMTVPFCLLYYPHTTQRMSELGEDAQKRLGHTSTTATRRHYRERPDVVTTLKVKK